MYHSPDFASSHAHSIVRGLGLYAPSPRCLSGSGLDLPLMGQIRIRPALERREKRMLLGSRLGHLDLSFCRLLSCYFVHCRSMPCKVHFLAPPSCQILARVSFVVGSRGKKKKKQKKLKFQLLALNNHVHCCALV